MDRGSKDLPPLFHRHGSLASVEGMDPLGSGSRKGHCCPRRLAFSFTREKALMKDRAGSSASATANHHCTLRSPRDTLCSLLCLPAFPVTQPAEKGSQECAKHLCVENSKLLYTNIDLLYQSTHKAVKILADLSLTWQPSLLQASVLGPIFPQRTLFPF